MDNKLKKELIEETTINEISEKYKPIVEIMGIKSFVLMGDYAKGVDIYFPKSDNILAPARNKRIQKEYNGYNMKELADKYDLTEKQIANVLKNIPHPKQMDFLDLLS